MKKLRDVILTVKYMEKYSISRQENANVQKVSNLIETKEYVNQ